jgi:hypothetical protein
MAGRPANAEARALARALAAPEDGTQPLATAQIAARLGASQRQVRRWCEGLLGGPGPRPAVDAVPFAEAVAAGASQRQAEKETGVSRRTAGRRAAKEK